MTNLPFAYKYVVLYISRNIYKTVVSIIYVVRERSSLLFFSDATVFYFKEDALHLIRLFT